MLLACAGPPAPSSLGTTLAVPESLYADLREIRDRIDVTLATNRTAAPDGTTLAALKADHNIRRAALLARLSTVRPQDLKAADTAALRVMRRTLARDLGPLTERGITSDSPERTPECSYSAASLIRKTNGLDSLRGRIYACYGWAQHHIAVGVDTLDRLSVLGALGHTEDPARRRELFIALDPVWRSINGNNQSDSPYRLLIAETAKRQGRAEPPAVQQARASGVLPDSLERWLLAMLETWRDASPDSLKEPWDWYYGTSKASRTLSPRIPHNRLTELNAAVYRSLGADVASLHVQYDLAPREGKTPVAYCTFGRRPRFRNGAWDSGEPWVFATYRRGGLDNLAELLHETGHAIHIAAIRTRPAFTDWPDSDPFTEAIADFVALDVAEPAWQQHWLGDSVPLADGLRARYGSVVFDVAWALFEHRMQRDPAADPNQVWTALTRDYLRIRPHPELSWWAMRGQLVDSPGYMMNYAVGAMIIAAVRARTTELHGAFTIGDSTWYAWVAPRLFRFGLERPTKEVLEEFLGGPVSPAALLEDMRRMRGTS